MSKRSKLIAAFIAVAIIAVGAAVLTNKKPADDGKKATDSNESAVTITYDDTGFSPAEAAVASGGTVKIVNESDGEIAPSSDPHPTHTNNTGLNACDSGSGESKTFTVTEKGTWGYHNHYSASEKGALTVE